jgi:hypothetical protein
LELRVNGQRALRLEPADGSPNVIGGADVNFISPGSVGGTIAGGGSSLPIGAFTGSFSNSIGFSYGTIGGGAGNRIEGYGFASTVAGGYSNRIGQAYCSISGGWANAIDGQGSSIPGGEFNLIQTDAVFSSIAGGANNLLQMGASVCAIGGGSGNLIQSNSGSCFIAEGDANAIRSGCADSAIGGGMGNVIESNCEFSAIAGGNGNDIGSGVSYGFIGGGLNNSCNGQFASVSGGSLNQASGNAAFVGGGNGSIALGDSSAIVGGEANSAFGKGAFVGGGVMAIPDNPNRDHNNIANGMDSSIAGGSANTANGQFSAIPGGDRNTALGANSFAAGHRARALQDGSFVWADANEADFASSTPNQFAVRCTGSAAFVTAIDASGNASAGVILPAGSGSWSSLSDRNAKENFEAVNAREVLARVASMPIGTWNYKSQDKTTRHLGPMAQDFRAAFHLGEDERHIASVDEEGVALASIQALNQLVHQKEAKIRELETRLEKLEQLANDGQTDPP